ncbi:hypothetical protein RB195_002810 [Necator americanus]|uniref:Uncharacterized protein n=1 Tax=Necator americanus TaxID=51031 RepID=A0ABR1DL06_NECAM
MNSVSTESKDFLKVMKTRFSGILYSCDIPVYSCEELVDDRQAVVKVFYEPITFAIDVVHCGIYPNAG